MLKKTLANSVTTTEINDIYEKGRSAGAFGGKLLGAGGGGFILFVAPKEKHPIIKKILSNIVYVNFKLDHDGSKVIVYDPEETENS